MGQSFRRDPRLTAGRQKAKETFHDAHLVLPALTVLAKKPGWPSVSIAWGQGAQVGDIDNNVYTDFHLAGGDLILGHAPRNVILAVKKYAERGLGFGILPKVKIDLARFMLKAVPSFEQLEFFYDRASALRMAVRLAQKATGKIRVAWVGDCGGGRASGLMPEDDNVPQSSLSYSLSGDTDVYLPFNNPELSAEILEAGSETLACIVLAPVHCRGGIQLATREFLRCLRDGATRLNAVLIFDESQTGFRGQLAGFQGECGILPDVTCLGGILGGGFSLSAVGGRKKILQHLTAEQDYVPVDNPIIFRAALATLKLLTPDFYRTLNTRAEKLVFSMNQALTKSGLAVQVENYYSMMGLNVSPSQNQPPLVLAADFGASFQENLLKQGILGPPSMTKPFFISSAHRGKDFLTWEAGLKVVFNLAKSKEKSYDV